MNLVSRPLGPEDDFWRMREFLRELFLLNGRLARTWHISRLEIAHAQCCAAGADVPMERAFYLWEAAGQIAALLLSEGRRGQAHLAVHPAFRTAELEEEMLGVAQEQLFRIREEAHRLVVWAPADDLQRQDILARRGYAKLGEHTEFQWRRDLDSPIPDQPAPAGYTLRSLGDGLEVLERCYAAGLAFQPQDVKIAVDYRDDPAWYRDIQSAPLYRRDLDLVAVAPDGSIAAFCTVWFDDVTRTGGYEPVGTVPAHQRRGLANALMTEGLRRLRRMGAVRAFVSGFDDAANALYRTALGPEHELYEPWAREWRCIQ